jgi:putative Mn2+ efflux pump MntP
LNPILNLCGTSIDFLSLFSIALGLSADCIAVALSGSISTKKLPLIPIFRASIVFGILQALMPVVGWFAGRTIVELISDYDHWLAFTLLTFIGSKMGWESLRSGNNHSRNSDSTRGGLLITLAVATSINALIIGLTFAFMEVNITLANLTIGSIVFVVSSIGFLIGKEVGKLVGERAETVGGMVLIGIGLKILLKHTS